VTFLVQFFRFRRGVPEVIRTLNLAAENAEAALAGAKRVVTASGPSRTEAIRVMDDGGRTLIDWRIPVETVQPLPQRRHRFAAGQSIAYTEDGTRDDPRGGFEIVGLTDPGTHEPAYVIRTAEETSNRLVKEHELQEDLGARVRGW
jgi:hypothetical protein